MNKIKLKAFFTITYSCIFLTFPLAEANEVVPNVWAKPQLDTSRRIEMTCGGTLVEITCGYNKSFKQTDDRICSKNTLILTLQNGQKIHPKAPETFEPSATPIAIECGYEEKNPENYLLRIVYLSGSYNCSKCYQDLILDTDGEIYNKAISPKKISFGTYRNSVHIENRSTNYPDDYLYMKEGK